MKVISFQEGLTPLYQQVNEWLEIHKDIKVIDIKYSSTKDSQGVLIMYEEMENMIKINYNSLSLKQREILKANVSAAKTGVIHIK